MIDPDLSLGATTQLYWEHRVIEAAVACARKIPPLATATAGEHADVALIVRFFDQYVHAWHYANEETYFVPMLRTMGTSSASSAVLRIDEEHGQSHVALAALQAHLAEAGRGDALAPGLFDAAWPRFLDLVLTHVHHEDRYLYRMLMSALSSPAQRHLGWVLRHAPASEGRQSVPLALEDEVRALSARYAVAFPGWDETLASLDQQGRTEVGEKQVG